MMNFLALGLVLTSLLTAGFFSPTPQNHNSKQEDVIVKEGHRVVVVEFEKDHGNTKVLISPQDSHSTHNFEYQVSDKLSETPKDASSTNQNQDHNSNFSPRELVCDAYGKCKHKIASAIGISKEKVNDMEDKAKGAVLDGVKKTAQEASYKAQQTGDNVTHLSNRAKDKITEKATEIKQGVKNRASDMMEGANEKMDGVKEKATEIKQGMKNRASDVIEGASEKMDGVKEKVSDKAKEAGEIVGNAKDRVEEGAREGKKELGEILLHAREVAVEIYRYVVPPEGVSSVAGVLHLMGFAAAYGMCVWVTFGSSYVLANALPRNQFAIAQTKVYPVYFKAMVYSLGTALLGYLIGERKRFSPFGLGSFQGVNLLASLVMNLVNMLYLEPRAAKVMFQRMKEEKEDGMGKEGHTIDGIDGTTGNSISEIAGRGSSTGTGKQKKQAEYAAKWQMARLTEVLSRLNSYSSLLNVLTLVSLTWHLVHLGRQLHTTCRT